MNIDQHNERVWTVLLPSEPQLHPELAVLRNRIASANDVNLVLDLARVELISSPCLGILLDLRDLLSRRGNRLILCKTRLATKCLLRIAGLETVFDFAGDRAQALRILGPASGSPTDALPAVEEEAQDLPA